MKTRVIIFLSLLTYSQLGCKKFIEIEGPTTSVNSLNVYKQDATAASVLTGVYTKLSSGSLLGTERTSSLYYLAGLSSDELSIVSGYGSPQMDAYYSNSLTSTTFGFGIWNDIYTQLYTINAALEGVTESNTLTPSVKKQLLGEAKFMRAFYFFYLVNLYGDIPLVTNTDYRTNSLITRAPKAQVWNQIISDLKDAESLLSINYLGASLVNITQERLRPTKAAAVALLARSYLYIKEWKLAEEQAVKLIGDSNYELVTLENVFLKNSKEVIWQLQPTTKGLNTPEALSFVIDPNLGFNGTPAVLSNSLMEAFDSGDQRKVNWIGQVEISGTNYYYAYKYKKVNRTGNLDFPVDEYSTVFRLAEQYLILAEAQIQQNKIVEGITTLNTLRDRARDKTANFDTQLKLLTINLTKEEALLAVEHEFRTEFFTEWGHRWLNLKRTGRVDAVMNIEAPKKSIGGIWHSYQQWYPIEFRQLQANPELIQNSGY